MIWGENHRLRLAPFATVYASLEEHLAAACIQTGLTSNFWARPVLMTTTPTSASVGGGSGSTPLGTDRTVAFSADGSEALALLPPARFMPFHVPFDVPPAVARGEGAAPICEVPPEYARALTGHVAKIGKLRDELSALRCTDEVRRLSVPLTWRSCPRHALSPLQHARPLHLSIRPSSLAATPSPVALPPSHACPLHLPALRLYTGAP